MLEFADCGVEVGEEAFGGEDEFVAEEAGEEVDVVVEVLPGNALVDGAAALFNAGVHGGADDGFKDEEVDYGVAVEGELEPGIYVKVSFHLLEQLKYRA